MMNKQRAELTFKDNQGRARHGWVRLTPAYSVRLVETILDEHPDIRYILDPFSGTGTTALLAGQRGLRCDGYDINPFLVWLAEAKCANYSASERSAAQHAARSIVRQARLLSDSADLWLPPISNIERWWSASTLYSLSQIFHALNHQFPDACAEKNLLLVAFCRLVMQRSNAAFNHQSMSFKAESQQLRLFSDDDDISQRFQDNLDEIVAEAAIHIPGSVTFRLTDARQVEQSGHLPGYEAVITSPPYVNRMSYIRELRPYMYWLGYLRDGREAGELDWQAVGGTWGIATSKLNAWTGEAHPVSVAALPPILAAIARSSELLSRYVHKYFADMQAHFASLYAAVAPGGKLFYIVGNSKFYDTLVPAEALYASLMRQSGFEAIEIASLRKRNSKKELFEYLVTARKPSG